MKNEIKSSRRNEKNQAFKSFDRKLEDVNETKYTIKILNGCK